MYVLQVFPQSVVCFDFIMSLSLATVLTYNEAKITRNFYLQSVCVMAGTSISVQWNYSSERCIKISPYIYFYFAFKTHCFLKKLKYSWFTTLGRLQFYSKMIQCFTCIYFRLFPTIGYHHILKITRRAVHYLCSLFYV